MHAQPQTHIAIALGHLEEHESLTSAELGVMMGMTPSRVVAILGKHIRGGMVLAERIPGKTTRFTLNRDYVSGPSISADSMPGRILLALRAGDTEYGQLGERFGAAMSSALYALKSQGLVAYKDSWGVTYCLTEAGRAACPTRRKPTERRNHAQAA